MTGRAPVRDLLDRAVTAGIVTPEQAAAVAALDARPEGRRRGAVLAEVLGYVGAALAVAALLWWRWPTLLAHVAAFGAAVATLFAVLDRLDDSRFGWSGPVLWALGLAWLAASALPPGGRGRPDGGVWRPAEPGWVLGALAIVAGPLAADSGRTAWLVVGVGCAAALVVVGVRTRRPWVAAVGTGGVFLSVPLAVGALFDARLGPLVGILVVGLALVAAAVLLSRSSSAP